MTTSVHDAVRTPSTPVQRRGEEKECGQWCARDTSHKHIRTSVHTRVLVLRRNRNETQQSHFTTFASLLLKRHLIVARGEAERYTFFFVSSLPQKQTAMRAPSRIG
jgi:hypothetical protein